MRADSKRTLTVAYVTARREPRFDWFWDSLARQVTEPIKIIVVDHFKNERDVLLKHLHSFNGQGLVFKHVEPKPNVWNGRYRLTKEDWFAAANARNTALVLCETTHIVFLDDLSVLMPGWLDAVNAAVAGNYVAAGAYKKVKNIRIVDDTDKGVKGVAYEEFPEGVDHRIALAKEDVQPCRPGWLFGCSCVFPVEALLTVGGWPEYCDSLGSEDTCLGQALKNAGFELRFCRKMLTLEADDLHFVEPPMKRTDKGVSPKDKSHGAHDIAMRSKFFSNYFPDGGIRAVRDSVLAGNPFPVIQEPKHDWWDNQPISEM